MKKPRGEIGLEWGIVMLMAMIIVAAIVGTVLDNGLRVCSKACGDGKMLQWTDKIPGEGLARAPVPETCECKP